MTEKITQQEVEAMMRNGWSCHHAHGIRDSGWWTLQEGAQGHGGKTLKPHGQTMNALIRRGIIKHLPYEAGMFHTVYVLVKP